MTGDAAPDFSLATADGGTFTQDDLRGTATVFVFYPFAFSPVCTDQLQLYEEVLEDIGARGARVFGVSCDSTWSQTAFREKLGVTIEQLSDFEPKGAACAALDVLHPGGFPQRAILVFDADGVERFRHVADSPAELPGVNVIFDGLDRVPA